MEGKVLFNSVDVILDVKLDAGSIDQVSETLAQNLLKSRCQVPKSLFLRVCTSIK